MSLAVIGATSVIARETAKAFWSEGHSLLLISRDTRGVIDEYFEEVVAESKLTIVQEDISHADNLERISTQIIESFDDDPYVLVAVGSVGVISNDNINSNSRIRDTLDLIDVNFRNIAALVSVVAEELEERERGCLIILSSVAGDRGRQSNFVYGAAKAGLSVYAQGLRNRLFFSGVHVLTVKPGYVDTPMLHQALGDRYGDIPRLIIGNPEKVGCRIYLAAVKRKNVIYVPAIWRILMLFIKSIPEAMFKKMRL